MAPKRLLEAIEMAAADGVVSKEEREKIVLARDTVVRNTVAFLEGLP